MIRDWKKNLNHNSTFPGQVIHLNVSLNINCIPLPQKVETTLKDEAVLNKLYENRRLASCWVLVGRRSWTSCSSVLAAQFTPGELVTVTPAVMRGSHAVGPSLGDSGGFGNKVYEIQTRTCSSLVIRVRFYESLVWLRGSSEHAYVAYRDPCLSQWLFHASRLPYLMPSWRKHGSGPSLQEDCPWRVPEKCWVLTCTARAPQGKNAPRATLIIHDLIPCADFGTLFWKWFLYLFH